MPTLTEAEAALALAQSAKNDATEAFGAAMAKKDVTKALELAKVVERTSAELVKAEKALAAVKWESENGERIAAANELTTQLAGHPALVNAFRLGVKSVTIVPGEDGGFTVTANTGAVKAGRPKGSVNAGGTKGRHRIIGPDGTVHTSRSFLTELANGGNEDAAKALDRADNWEAHGLKAAPGFDAAVKRLLDTVPGYVREEAVTVTSDGDGEAGE